MNARACENYLAIARSASKVSRFFGPRYIGDDFFLGPNLVSFNRAVVPLLELSCLTKSKVKQANKMTFITHRFRVLVVSDVRERVRDFRITFALYVKKIFIN
jgi:hypothetical protein